ncbi:MAG: hypothetical protein H0X62_06185 [Bacteroidetes bacterium]|nr:hypothetical protein [Bacteroidota bacterium]
MCFSAEVSFGAAAAIGVVGVLAIKKVEVPKQILFASIPLLFALHQLTEGFVWLALANQDFEKLKDASVAVYLAIAQALWPFFVPLSILLLEKQQIRKWILACLLITGIIGSLFLAYSILSDNIIAEIRGHHIYYEHAYLLDFPALVIIFYFIPVTSALFVSSIKSIRALGFIIFLSAIISYLFFEKYFTSTWCFFGAFISIYILFIYATTHKAIKNNCINK